MAAALITGMLLSVAGLSASIVFGHTAGSSAEVLRHATLAVFATLMTLLAHSMTMFYLIGKGKAIREAVTEGELSHQFVADLSRVRRPVFSMATLAMALTMITAILGGGVDTRVVPAGFHSVMGYAAVAANLVALRAEMQALSTSARIVTEINRLLGA